MLARARHMVSAEDLIEMSGVETLHPGGLDLSRRIGKVLRLDPSRRILDVSSGKGVFACLYASEFGCRVVGIDISEKFTAEARARAARHQLGDKVEFRVGDSRSLQFSDGEFDVVVNECAVGLTAVGDPPRVLHEMVRVTKPGGSVVIHESTWRKALSPEEREDAVRRLGTAPFTVDEWRAMLADAGATTVLAEDWSGVEKFWKMRPDHNWNPKDPTDFLGAREKVVLLGRVVAKFGLGALRDVYRSRSILNDYLARDILGYALLVARKGPGA